MTQIETRLAELGVTLPQAPAPAANYVPFVTVGALVHISGQISQNAEGHRGSGQNMGVMRRVCCL